MAVHMRRNDSTGIPPSPTTSSPLDHAQVTYKDGNLVWADVTDASGHNELQATSNQVPAENLPKTEEVVFILKKPAGGYLIYSVTELVDSGDGTKKASDADASPFKLSTLAIPALPQEILDGYLLIKTPVHLRCGEDGGVQRSLHVVVSTKSGLCRARAFYDGVLRPLLGALGLEERSGDGQGYNLVVTQSAHSVRDFARDLFPAAVDVKDGQNTANTVILLSGDGGVVDLLNGIPGDLDDARHSTPTIALLPLGTGNALFHSLHKSHQDAPQSSNGDANETNGTKEQEQQPAAPSDFVLSLRTLFAGRVAPLPTFRAEFAPGSRLVLPGGGEAASNNDAAVPNDGEQSPEAGSGVNVTGGGLSQTLGPALTHLHGAIVASYGFHASLVWESDTPEYRRHGAKRFGMAAQELLKLSHAYSCVVEARLASNGDASSASAAWVRLGGNDEKMDAALGDGGRFNYVLATMVSNLEKTFTISPASRPLDGQLRLVTFGHVGGAKTMEIMMAAYQEGSHVGMVWKKEVDGGQREEKVGYDTVEEVRVTVHEHDARWRKVCVDGTIVELEKGGWMTVKKERVPRLGVLVGN